MHTGTNNVSANWIALQTATLGLSEAFAEGLLLEEEVLAVDAVIEALNNLNGGEGWVLDRLAERAQRRAFIEKMYGSLDEQEDDYEDFDDIYGPDWDLDDNDDDDDWVDGEADVDPDAYE